MARGAEFVQATSVCNDDETTISPGVRAYMREVAERNKGYGMCWACLEWHDDVREIECVGWLCATCRANRR